MTPCAVPRAPKPHILPADCCLSFYRGFFNQERGGQFWKPDAAAPTKFHPGLIGAISMAPHSSPGLPHVFAHWLIVVCLFFGHFNDPGVLDTSLRPPGAAAPPRPTKSETAISVVFAPDGDAWRLIPMVTRTDK